MPNREANQLSERELDILKLVATGASNKEIAQKLFISSNTVKVHIRNIFAKIGATSRTEAAMYAVRVGITNTISSQIREDNGLVTSLDAPDNALPEIHTFQDVVRSKYFIRYLGIFTLLVVIGIIVVLFLREKNILVFTHVSPTPTARVQWFALAGLPTPRKGLAVANYENKIITIGGESSQGISNVVERYDPQSNTWSALSSKPTAVTDINAAVIGGQIYIPGGRLATGQNTTKMEIFNPLSNQWSEGTPLPKPLSAYALAVFEGQMYLFGGWDGYHTVSDAYLYNPPNNTWLNISSMPTAREYAGAQAIGGKIYVIGGWDGQKALSVNEVFQADTPNSARKWTKGIELPAGRYGMGITNLADIIFLIGGQGLGGNPPVIALSTDEANWGQIESPLQEGWTFLGAVTVGTRLYVVGGKTEESLSDKLWSYQAIFTISLPIVR